MIWGDHSSLMSKGFLVYTVKVLYTKRLFVTDSEYKTTTGKTADVQSLVEQPFIYVMAQCSDSIAEKLSYIALRREDVMEMVTPMYIDGTIVKDRMRFFQGKMKEK